MKVKAQVRVDGINDTKQVTDKFRKRELIVKQEGITYDNFFVLQLINDMCDKVESDKIKVGDKLSVECELQGKKWNPKDGGETRVFMNLNVREMLVMSRAAIVPEPIAPVDMDYGQGSTTTEEDNLPF
jgi:single-strand DNA-binding protein